MILTHRKANDFLNIANWLSNNHADSVMAKAGIRPLPAPYATIPLCDSQTIFIMKIVWCLAIPCKTTWGPPKNNQSPSEFRGQTKSAHLFD